MTERGGKMMASNTLKKLIRFGFWLMMYLYVANVFIMLQNLLF